MIAIITSPNLDPNLNVSGISSVTKFIIDNNTACQYIHVELGKRDNEKRDIQWVFKLLNSYKKFIISLLNGKINLVHFNFALNKASILRDIPFIFITRIFKKKLIVHLHGGTFLMEPSSEKWLNFILSYLLSGSDSKIVLSELEKEVLINRFNAKNVVVLANCVDLKIASTCTKKAKTTLPLNVLFLGRITLSKGIEIIVEAFKILQQHNSQINFYCAGEGPGRNDFVAQMKSIIGDRFIYKGVLKGNEKVKTLIESDIFLLPALSGEGLPMALLEAMSFGLCPIVTNDGSISSIVKDRVTGFIVDKFSAEQIANRILELDLDRTLLDDLAQNAKKTILENFNPEIYTDKLNKLYENK